MRTLRWIWPVLAIAAIAAACSGFDEEVTPGTSDAGARDGSSPLDASPPLDASDENRAPVDCTKCRSARCDPQDGGCYPLVFVTKDPYPADFAVGPDAGNGITQADRICELTGRVGDASAPRFLAWLSDGANTAITRVTGFPAAKRPAVDSNGRVIAENYLALLRDSGLENGIELAANGATVSPNQNVWTGTDRNGGLDPGAVNVCDGWTSSDAGTNGARIGKTGAKDGRWTDAEDSQCHKLARLYCFEVGD